MRTAAWNRSDSDIQKEKQKMTSIQSFRGNAAGLEALMLEGKSVPFQYRKLNGSVRLAIGRIPRDFRREDMGQQGRLFRYWDAIVGGWRSFYVQNLL
jgi:hypothetical protein